ncbi:MAG: sulfite exporter TauE/SafE family protein, partial [Candidatus Latescibacteria bacterium]|nr:sulfite exporter TauE/SafE family protein [Candidatus Latescibacterota bacterium]
LYPGEPPEIITSISLAVVFFNALSGSVAYARMKRIDYKSGLLFSAATIPGAILGALTTAYIPRQLFDGVLGLLMLGMSVFLLVRPHKVAAVTSDTTGRRLTCTLVESDGTPHSYTYNPAVGIALSLVVGYVSSLLGIGGGIIHVPALVQLLNFPVHIATATSHFILAIMALTGTIVHIATGTFSHGIRRTIALGVGVLVGAQLGARLSSRVQGYLIIRSLAVVLGLAGIRIFLLAW